MEEFVTLSTGVRMEYVEQGDAGGVPVIFLHGVTDSWHSFERVLPLLPTGVRAFAISQRGHGDSSRPETGYLISDMSEDLRAFMDAVGLEQAVIAGHSMGSMVAQRFVVDHPERVSALVLMGAFSTLFADPGLTPYYETAIAPLTDPIDATFAREWQLSTLARPTPTEFLDTVVTETQKVPARVWREAFKGFLETPDFSAKLTGVTVPTLIQWGDRDTYTLRASQDRLASVIRGAKLVVYEGNGHAIHWEDPVRVTGDFVSFLMSRVSQGSRRVQQPSRRAVA
jgi:pimeloyl-ACP methyl ester carboxylesterase